MGFKGQGGEDHYLWPLIKGGRRRLKASERIGGVGYIIPLNKAPMRLNRHGNWTGGQYRRLLGQIKAYKGRASILNASGSLSSRKNRRRVGLFLSKDGRFVMGRSGSRGSVQRVALLRKESPVYRKQLTLLEKLPDMYMKAFWSRLYKELLERNLRKRA